MSPAQAAVTAGAHSIVPANPMSVADAFVVRNPTAGLHHPAQIAAGMQPGMTVEAHRVGVQATPHVPISGAMDRMYLGQRMMGNERVDLAALYNNPAYIARQQQYPAAAMQQAMYDMQSWQQQMRREPAFERESSERSTKVSIWCLRDVPYCLVGIENCDVKKSVSAILYFRTTCVGQLLMKSEEEQLNHSKHHFIWK